MIEYIETIIIGGGQAGLATSYSLQQQGCEHVVFEQASRVAHAWQDDRWDSFVLNTPNWTVRLPGGAYSGNEPDGFMSKRELAAYFDCYAAASRLPVQLGMRVTSVEQAPDGQGYLVKTNAGDFQARNVVVATGLFQQPKFPPFAGHISTGIFQVPAGQYRNPQALPPGAVLVVGSGQSGVQVAEELYQSGRKVYLCVGGAGRAPRRYRGRDIFEWMSLSGFTERTPDKLPSEAARFAANPQVSGRDGGHNLNLHQFSRDGVRLLGRLANAEGDTIQLAPDLKENLAKADRFEADLLKAIDDYIARAGVEAPLETVPQLNDGYQVEELAEVDLKSDGVTSIIWALGYRFDYSMIKLPTFDRAGFPVQQRGVTTYPGLYFVGMPWMPDFKSGLLLGVGEAAGHIAEQIAGNIHLAAK